MESFEKQRTSIQDIKKESITAEDEAAKALIGEELAEKFKDRNNPSEVPENLSELVKNDTTAGEWMNEETEDEQVPGVHDVEIHYEEKEVENKNQNPKELNEKPSEKTDVIKPKANFVSGVLDENALSEIERVEKEQQENINSGNVKEESPAEEPFRIGSDKPKAGFMGGVLDESALSEIERVEKEQQENITPHEIEEQVKIEEEKKKPGKRSLISGIINHDALDEVFKESELQEQALKSSNKEDEKKPGNRSLISGIINPDALDEVFKEQEAQEAALKSPPVDSEKNESWVKSMFDKEENQDKNESWVKNMFDKEGKELGEETAVAAGAQSPEGNQEKNEWKSIRKEYKDYRVKVDVAREKFEKLADDYAKTKQDSGLLAKFVDNSILKGKHGQMLSAQKEYYALLEGLRGLREQRINYRAKKLAEGDSEEEKRNVSTYVGLHEMLLEKQVDNEAVMLERLKYQESKNGEPNSKLLQFAKNKWKWYINQPRHKRILYGAVLGGAVAGVAATGLGMPAALAAGGAAAARRGVGGFFGAHAALITKRFADSHVEKEEAQALQSQHEEFQDTSLLESSQKRQSIRNRTRWGKRKATGYAAGAAMVAGGGVTASSEAVTGMVEAKVDAAVDAAKGFIGVEDAQDAVEREPMIIESKQTDVSHMESRPDDVDGGQSSTEQIPQGLNEQDTISQEEAHRIAESARKNVQEMIDGEAQEKVQPYNVRQFEEAKANFEQKYSATHRADGAERVIANVEEPVPGTEETNVRVEEKHSATHRDDGAERVIANVEEPVPIERILTSTEEPMPTDTTERVIANVEEPVPTETEEIKDLLAKYLVTDDEQLAQETGGLKMEGVYEGGSSVERELQQFLESNDWVKEHHPDMTDNEVGAIAHRIRLHLEDHPELQDKFRIHDGDWNKVLENDQYSFYIDKDFIENEINEYLSIENKALPSEPNAPGVTEANTTSEIETPKAEEVASAPETQKAPEFDDVQKKVAPPDDLPVYQEVNKPIEVDKSVAEESLNTLRSEETPAVLKHHELVQRHRDAYFLKYPEWSEKYHSGTDFSDPTEQKILKTQYELEQSNYETLMQTEKMYGPTPNDPEAREIARILNIDVSKKLAIEHDMDLNGKINVLKINDTVVPDELRRGIAPKYPDYLINVDEKGDWINPDVAQETQQIKPPTFAEEIKGAEKLIHEQGADYYGEQTRESVEAFFEDGTLESKMRPHVLSSWGPISHAKLQDILDGEGSIKYAIGDNPPITMGKSVEDLCKSVVVQLEKQIDFETFERLRKENITLGDFVKKVSEHTGSDNIV